MSSGGVDILVALEGPLAGQRWTVTEAGLRIGRDTGNEVSIPDQNVSRQHARAVLYKGVVWVQDAGSRNGVFVNGERVPDQRQLQVGDRITVGPHVFEIVHEAEAPRAAPPRTLPPLPPARDLARWWPVLLVLGLGLAVLATTVMLRERAEPTEQTE